MVVGGGFVVRDMGRMERQSADIGGDS